MRQFPVPMNILDEEKLVGGVLSLRQVAWLCAAVIAAAAAWVALRVLHAPAWLFLVSATLLLAAGTALAFIWIAAVSLDRYIVLWVLFQRRKRRWVLRRDER
jgi:hypothetical protein